jgi:hypothetical protein
MSRVYRAVDYFDVVHTVLDIPGQIKTHWTPLCCPDEDWVIHRDSATEAHATCLWCVTRERYR